MCSKKSIELHAIQMGFGNFYLHIRELGRQSGCKNGNHRVFCGKMARVDEIQPQIVGIPELIVYPAQSGRCRDGEQARNAPCPGAARWRDCRASEGKRTRPHGDAARPRSRSGASCKRHLADGGAGRKLLHRELKIGLKAAGSRLQHVGAALLSRGSLRRAAWQQQKCIFAPWKSSPWCSHLADCFFQQGDF